MIVHAALLTLALAAPAGHGKPARPRPSLPTQPCTVKLAGTVNASFQCTVSARFTQDTGVALVISPTKLPKGVGAFLAGPFQIKGPVEQKVPYGPAAFKSGRMMLSGPRHVAYGAEAGPTPRGDLSVIFDSIVASAPEKAGAAGGQATISEHSLEARGTLAGRLVPKQGKGEVSVTISF